MCSSVEGNIRWISKENFLKEEVAHGMDKVFEIAMNGKYTECFCEISTREERLF